MPRAYTLLRVPFDTWDAKISVAPVVIKRLEKFQLPRTNVPISMYDDARSFSDSFFLSFFFSFRHLTIGERFMDWTNERIVNVFRKATTLLNRNVLLSRLLAGKFYECFESNGFIDTPLPL